MNKVFRWFLINSIFATLVYFATVGGHPNVGNLLIALTAALCYGTIARQLGDAEKKAADRAALIAHPVPYWMDVLYDLAIILTLVWFGWWVTTVMYAVHALLILELRKGK
jgi:hypothetical protein